MCSLLFCTMKQPSGNQCVSHFKHKSKQAAIHSVTCASQKTGLHYLRVNHSGVFFSGFHPPSSPPLYGYKTKLFGNIGRVPLLKLHLEHSVVKKKKENGSTFICTLASQIQAQRWVCRVGRKNCQMDIFFTPLLPHLCLFYIHIFLFHIHAALLTNGMGDKDPEHMLLPS